LRCAGHEILTISSILSEGRKAEKYKMTMRAYSGVGGKSVYRHNHRQKRSKKPSLPIYY
jgi:hypothetical protein